MSHLMLKFPNRETPRPYVKSAKGLYLQLEDGREIMDVSCGWTHYAVLGYSHPEVLDAMREQLGRFTHLDYDMWRNRQHDELSDILVSQAPDGLDMVYFCGNSGSESTEAAMKLSYQIHYEEGKHNKQWIIYRDQSYHGATLQSMSVSERDILDFYIPLFPEKRARVPQHYPSRMMKPSETLEQYARRGASDLEGKILELGPENVCCFIAETQLGSLIGDVPPAPNYWKYIREICNKYDVHLILDEIYCGLGRSGKIYNCSWDGITPDFVCVGKTLAAGYAPLSAVVTKSGFLRTIANGQGRVQHGHTHQGYALGVAAAIAVQKIVHKPETLANVLSVGKHMMERLNVALSDHPFFFELRGRGLAFSIEYKCVNQPGFGAAVQERLEEKYGIILSAKWHRIAFTPPYTISISQSDMVIDAVIEVFKEVAETWPTV
jgi:adenosylmethionine-8-amino-7-oxononanoate aminotransferase